MSEEILQDQNTAKGTEAAKEKEVVVAGVHNYSREESYVKPTDPRVLKKLE